MSGHSKWATIRRAKAVNDQARGKVFSKLSRQITIAVKEGGGPDIDSNYRLRVVVEAARASNMPKDNIERAITKAASGGDNLVDLLYEGFGPSGVNLLISASTDNKNRTSQEIKNILERSGGSLAGPGAVSFNFDTKGYVFAKYSQIPKEEQALNLIDSGAEDYLETDDGFEIYTKPADLSEVSKKLIAKGIDVTETKLIKKPINIVAVSEKEQSRVYELIERLDELDEVNDVFVNA